MMRSVPAPGVVRQIAVLALLLFGGAAAGTALARAVASESPLAAIAGFLVLPLALVTGYQLWIGLALVRLAPELVRVVTGRARPAPLAPTAVLVPPGTAAFVVTGVGAGVAAGVVVGVLAGPARFLPALVLFAGAGLTYGLAARALAMRAYLPFPAEA
jgi:hypothetical protein